MKRIFLLTLLLTLIACNNKQTQTPSVASTVNKSSSDYSTIQQFSVINSGYREFQGQPAAWVMFSKPVASSRNINQYFSSI